jgi:hypothetical protein
MAHSSSPLKWTEFFIHEFVTLSFATLYQISPELVKFIVIHTEARKELDAAIAYYEVQKVGLGLDLLSEVQKVLGNIQQNPNLGTLYKKLDV